MLSDKRVLCLAPVGALDHQTGILNAVNSFAASGYQVDVWTVRNTIFPQPKFESSNVRVKFMPWTFHSEREPRTLVTLLFSLWVLFRARGGYDAVFAGGIRGLIAAYAYSFLRRAFIINYQMELYLADTPDGGTNRLFKVLERRAARASRVSIEHGEERAKLLSQDLGVPRGDIVIVPNAPIGNAHLHSSNYLHERLGIPESRPLLLCPGTIADAFASPQVVSAARALPHEWTCVMHSAQPRRADDSYIEQLRALAGEARVVFSLEPLPYARIDDIFGSARIGIALYAGELGANYSTVGLASGKLSHFLKVGVPVIVSPLPGLADFVLEQRVGLVLEDPRQLGELVGRIEADHAGYRQRAARAFDEYLSFQRSFSPVIVRVEHWNARSAASAEAR